MLNCPKCSRTEQDNAAKFCSACGAQHGPAELPFVGVPATRGIYRITFPPQEGEFSSEESACDAVRHSHWNNGRPMEGGAKVEFVRSTVGVFSHPFECMNCSGTPSATVTPHIAGKCGSCGGTSWRERQE
jgi:hypothetical protein